MNKPNRVLYTPECIDKPKQKAKAIHAAMIEGYPVMFHDHGSEINCNNYKLVYESAEVPHTGCWFWGQ